jgi:hypothetical protein
MSSESCIFISLSLDVIAASLACTKNKPQD